MPPDFDAWPDEPDDPESRWGDPENDLVSVPSVDVPEPSVPEEAGAGIEIDGEVAEFFWTATVYANVALGGIGIGVVMLLFRGQWRVGGGAVAIGCFALYRTYDVYRTYQAEIIEGSDEPTDTDDPTDAAADGNAGSTETADDDPTDTTCG